MAPELHHCAHAALAAILLAPFPVHATHYSHAHLHACLGVRVHGGRGCLGPVSREHPRPRQEATGPASPRTPV